MSIQKNAANTLRLYMTENSKTILELAGELEIARSSLQNYLKGKILLTVQLNRSQKKWKWIRKIMHSPYAPS